MRKTIATIAALTFGIAGLTGLSNPVSAQSPDTVPAGWSHLDQGWLDAMAGEDEGRDFTACVIQVADTTTVICPDGWTWTS